MENIDFDFVYRKPKGQLFKWVGNKFRYSNEIASYLPTSYNKFIEPFVGTGAVLATISPKHGIASDTLKPLIDFWNTLKTHPQNIINYYHDIINKFYSDPQQVYQSIKDSYNKNPNPLDLIILSRTCYGGVIRFTKQGSMSTPLGPHKPILPKKFETIAHEWRKRIKNIEFINADFSKTMALAGKNDLIYCDPPYVDSQKILYGAQNFSFTKLIEEIASAKNRGAKIVLSIDGKKKSGEKNIELNIPKGIFEREIFLECGSSMLKRFQNGGNTMLGENVCDRLLLTW